MTEKLTLVLVVGLPGAGKSTLAIEIGHVFGWPVIDKDTLKSSLLEEGLTNETAGSAAYQLMYALGRDFLVHQKISVIFDSPDPYLHKIDELIQEARADLKIILCLAEREVRNQRVAQRQGKLSQPIGISTTQGDGRQRYTHLPPGTLMLQTTQPLKEVVRQALDYLQSAE